jgi:hypothetical protein
MASAVNAFDHPKDTYIATYGVSNPNGKAEMILGSNGKGTAFMKMNDGNSKVREIYNYGTSTKTTIDESHKASLEAKMTEKDGEAFDMDRFKRNAKKALGDKTIDGHPCKGYQYEYGGYTGEVWVGEDCNLLVFSEVVINDGKTTVSLKELNKKPADEEFKYEIPADYKVISEKETVQKTTGEQ